MPFVTKRWGNWFFLENRPPLKLKNNGGLFSKKKSISSPFGHKWHINFCKSTGSQNFRGQQFWEPVDLQKSICHLWPNGEEIEIFLENRPPLKLKNYGGLFKKKSQFPYRLVTNGISIFVSPLALRISGGSRNFGFTQITQEQQGA